MIRRYLQRPDAAELAVLTVVLVIVFAMSYAHLFAVWEAVAGGPDSPQAWTAYVGPLSVDGLFAASWLKMRSRRRAGLAVGWLAWTAFYVSMLATLGGNMAGADHEWLAQHSDELAPWVAAWPAVAFALVFELLVGRGKGQPAPVVERDEPEHEDEPTAGVQRFYLPDSVAPVARSTWADKPALIPDAATHGDGWTPHAERELAVASALTVPLDRVEVRLPAEVWVQDPEPEPEPEPREGLTPAGTFSMPALDVEGRRRLVALHLEGAGRGRLESELGLTEKQARRAKDKLNLGMVPAGLPEYEEA